MEEYIFCPLLKAVCAYVCILFKDTDKWNECAKAPYFEPEATIQVKSCVYLNTCSMKMLRS